MKHCIRPKALARIRGGSKYPNLCGVANFYERYDGVILEVELFGLPKTETGFFAFHIHETGDCTGEGFPNTGSHLNPAQTMHPNHAGDLPPLLGDHGKADMKVFTDRIQLDEIIGKSIIVHAEPDDFHTQPSGNAGEKIACGVIQRVNPRGSDPCSGLPRR